MDVPLLLFHTTDGGGTWLPATLPPLPFVTYANNQPDPVLAVDPASASRLWLAWPVGNAVTTQRWDLFESENGGVV